MLLAKSFIVPVEPVQKPAEVVTSEKPFFRAEAGTSKMYSGEVTQPAEFFTGASPVQATGNVVASITATQPVDAPGTRMESTASMTVYGTAC